MARNTHLPDSDRQYRPRILVAADFQLVHREFYTENVWRPAKRAHEQLQSRTLWLSALTMIYDYDGQLYFADGRPYHAKDIDEVFTDPSNRWMTDFLESDNSGNLPRRISRKLERLRMIELYCRLAGGFDWAKIAS